MAKKPKWVWIARESGHKENWYWVSPFQECRMMCSRQYGSGVIDFVGDGQAKALCPKAVHRVLGIRLKPGEGPVRIKIGAELLD